MTTTTLSHPRRIDTQRARDIACIALCAAAVLGLVCFLFNIPWLVQFTGAIDQMALQGVR